MIEPIEGDFVPHQPVLYNETLHTLAPTTSGYYVDGTVGAGGHAWGILTASSPGGRLLGMDLDPQALALARQRLSVFGKRCTLVHASYTTLAEQISALGWPAVNGILLDLGVSSMQLETPQRGFSFQSDGPLDMRFDPTSLETAADLVNDLPEADLADLIWKYGEDPKSRQIAKAIIKARPITTTRQLAEIIEWTIGRPQKGIHPATRTFQALRISVNQELVSIISVLPTAIAALAPGGRLVIIAFHSLEDRIVKQYFHRESRDCICPPRQPICTCGHKASINEITRHPIRASEEELHLNPRARSARLRVAEKI
ncbi:MAG: 16S rRNA (cytosine(1402)-N(4))-methyltransferase RsmH [Chloroflexi bacterium]|nr:16S rRNA (cytosine(1402)-N(4))-methyltransferase RsmH [Chloroflexota bacterium]